MKISLAAIFSLLVFSSSGQAPRKISVYLSGQYAHTIYSISKENNSGGIGLGAQMLFHTGATFKPMIDLTATVFEGNKVLLLHPDGSPVASVGSMLNLFAGASWHPARHVYLSLLTGPSFISGKTHLGLKSAAGCYFSRDRRWTGNISWLNVFNVDSKNSSDYGSVSVSVGLKIF